MDELWHRAVRAAFHAGVAARLVFSTGMSARRLHAMGLLTDDELAEYLAIPVEERSVWERADLLERARLHLVDTGEADDQPS